MVALALCCAVSVYAQDNLLDAATERRLKDYFLNYKFDAATGYAQARMKSYRIDNRQRIVTITANDAFAAQDFTAKMVSKIYRKVSRILPSPYDTYKIRIAVNGVTIDLMVDGDMADPNSIVRAWGNIDYKGNAWVRNVSRPSGQPSSHGLCQPWPFLRPEEGAVALAETQSLCYDRRPVYSHHRGALSHTNA